MSEEVKVVTDVVKDIADVKVQAKQVAEDLRKNISDVKEALGLTQEISDALRSAGAELRGILGTQTNNPPKDDK